MRVLVVDPSLFTLPYDHAFCSALARAGVDVTLVGRQLRAYEQSLASEPFAFANLFYRRSGKCKDGWQTPHLGRLCKGAEHALGLYALDALAAERVADIVHFQWLMLPFLDSFALSRLRRRSGLVLTVHNSDLTTHSTSAVVGRLGAWLQGRGRRGAVLGFDRYVTHTIKTVAALETLGIPSDRILLLAHPTLKLDMPSPAAPAAGPREILFFGAIKPYKGLEVLIEAGLALAARRRDFRITIAGRPFQPMDQLHAAIAAAGVNDAFRFDLRYVPDEQLAAYLAEAAIVVFPYREIDSSGALALAVGFGKPIIASRVGVFAEPSVKEHVELVPIGDPQALAAKLAELLDSPARAAELGLKAAALATRLPSWTTFAETCITTYATILEERSSSDHS